MLRELIVSKEVRDVRAARWEGYKQLAMRLPDHHVLGVELVRTRHDETAAVLTVVRHGEPVQYVVMGDAQGRVKPNQDGPRDPQGQPCSHEHALLAPMAARIAGGPVDGNFGDASPDGMALGEPPVKQPVVPGAIGTLAGVLLATTFGLGDHVVGHAST